MFGTKHFLFQLNSRTTLIFPQHQIQHEQKVIMFRLSSTFLGNDLGLGGRIYTTIETTTLTLTNWHGTVFRCLNDKI